MSFHVFRGEGWSLTPFGVAVDGNQMNPKTQNINVQNGGAIICSNNIIAPGSANASFTGVNFAQNTAVEAVGNTLTSGMQAGLVGQLARPVGVTVTSGAPSLFIGIVVSLAPAA